MSVLGLNCCARAFPGCGERGLFFAVVPRLLIALGSLVAQHGGLQELWLMGIVAL